MAANKRKQDEKHLKILRDIASLTHNRQCFDCGQRGPTYVNMTIGAFVCTSCSGILRGINPPQRIKSISMTSFSTDDIEFLKCHGNDFCRKVWLGLYDSRTSPEFTSKDEQKVRDFMAQKYEKKRWYVAPTEAMKEEARRMNEPVKQVTTKPLRQLLGANAPKLIVPPVQLGQPAASPGSPGITQQSTQQQQTPTSQQTTVSSMNATADLLGALGSDPFASSTTAPPGGGGFANFESFNSQGGSFQVSSSSTNFLQPLGSQSTSAVSNSLLSTSPQQQQIGSEKYSGLADLFSVETEPAAPPQKINWDGTGGSQSVSWNSSGGSGGVGWNSSGNTTSWGGSSGPSSTFGSAGFSSGGTGDTASFGSAPGGNPFGASAGSAAVPPGNPFMAAPGQPASSQNIFSGQQQAQQTHQQMGGFGQFSGASAAGGQFSAAGGASYRAQPVATGFGVPTGATGFGAQTSAAGFAVPTNAAGFGAQTGPTGFGVQPSAAGYGGGGMFAAVPQSQTGQFGMQNGGAQPQGGWNQPSNQMAGFGQPGGWQSQANTVSMGGAAMAGLATAQFKQQPQWGQPQPAAMGNPFMNMGAQQQVIPPKSNSTNPFL